MFKGDKETDIRRLQLRDIEPEWVRIQEQILQTL